MRVALALAATLLALSAADARQPHGRDVPYPPPPCYGCGRPAAIFGPLRTRPPDDPGAPRSTLPNPRASHTGGTED